jgi:hypothetical protein
MNIVNAVARKYAVEPNLIRDWIEKNSKPSRKGWLTVAAEAAAQDIVKQRAKERTEEEQRLKELEQARPIWGVSAQWGSYSWSGCLYGFKVVCSDGYKGDLRVKGVTFAEASAAAKQLTVEHEKIISCNKREFQAFLSW